MYINRPVFLSEETLTNWERIERELERASNTTYEITENQANNIKIDQSLLYPESTYARLSDDLPTSCRYNNDLYVVNNLLFVRCRFYASGTIAGDGFANADQINCTFSMINKNRFCVLWPLLQNLSQFYRCDIQPDVHTNFYD